MRRAHRGGRYLRVCHPWWEDCLDTTPSRRHGGRWNPPGSFGVLYLNQTREVAAANVRRNHTGRAIGLFDLAPERRPYLLEVRVAVRAVVDAVTAAGLTALGLPSSYPHRVGWGRCQPVGQTAFEAGEAGIACRSAAECPGPGQWLGEELALFARDGKAEGVEAGASLPFEAWYLGAPATLAQRRNTVSACHSR